MSGNDNYPEGVTDADIEQFDRLERLLFGDTELQDAYRYRQYLTECSADGVLPLSYELWLDEYVESLR